MDMLRYGPGACGDLDDAARHEWLVTDGLGGYAMGTLAGLRTRRYHGLLVVASPQGGGRHLGLVALDPVLVLGLGGSGSRVRLATWEWAGGAVDPAGHTLLAGFTLADGVPTWRWQVGDVVVEQSVSMLHGRPAVAVAYRLLAGGPVLLELGALCTWRDVHGERVAGPDPEVAPTDAGFIFEGRYRVAGPGFEPGGAWYRGAYAREEAARGLNAVEDLWYAGSFTAALEPGRTAGVTAWADRLDEPPPPAADVVEAARRRARRIVGESRGLGDTVSQLVLAADQFVVGGTPRVMAGYPWFTDWGRDTMTSYEGLFLATGRADEGRRLLLGAGATVSEGMVVNTADTGRTEYNSIDATLWFLHAVGRHVEVTGDTDLAAALAGALTAVVDRYAAGTRFGIGVDPTDGLLRGGADGVALTWMDARVEGQPVTWRAGKPVEVNALWVRGLAVVGRLLASLGRDTSRVDGLRGRAVASFGSRFVRPGGAGLYDVVDPAGGACADDPTVRPNQLLAVSLPDNPLDGAGADPDLTVARGVLAACRPLLTPLGLRSLDPADTRYRPAHRGGPAERDGAYHQGTVWPWLIGPYVDATRRVGLAPDALLGGLRAHLGEWGLGSVSETADGAAPHGATGCPFQAWSVAELLRVLRRG